ncbi:hypothetical protein CLD_1703 [Clostridium botulinum B1 str. Okra]|uniref:Uncharacterized protein n=1 Tax=Clostridium botulinum (strain Okra / Type B1) TaxID=498213 RepID=B1IL21_CLOBK|nr:hypothetical protein CLD_1703 [Clostridium botulinum B1 str. Okra]
MPSFILFSINLTPIAPKKGKGAITIRNILNTGIAVIAFKKVSHL